MATKIPEVVKVGTRLHEQLVAALKTRLMMSSEERSKQHDKWEKADELFQAYMPETDADRVRKLEREQAGIPHYTTIQIPYSYASLLTAHTYYASVFMGRSPVFQYQGTHGEPQTSEQAIEALMGYQYTNGGMAMPLYQWLLDPGKYGEGVIGHYWYEETIRVVEWTERTPTFMGIPLPGAPKKKERVESDVPGYHGHKLFNVRPYDFFPDPRVPIMRFQDGEFAGRYVEIGWHEFLEGAEDGRYFNVEAVREGRGNGQGGSTGSGFMAQSRLGGRNVTLPNENSIPAYDNMWPGVVCAYEVYAKVIPSEWGLGTGKRVELWWFVITTQGVLIGARAVGKMSNRFPFEVLAGELDMYGLFTRGMLETLKPLNDILSWLINTHFYNVRKVLNDQFVVDPSMVVMKDMEDPRPGKLIRLKPEAYGRDVRTMISQLQVVDVTKQHVQDAQIIMDLLQRVPGVTDNVMGMVNDGGRKTATEIRTSSNFGINRLRVMCEMFSAQGFGPLAGELYKCTQQYYTLDRKYRIMGSMAELAENYMQVQPSDIAGSFDFVPVDGTLPIDRFAMANLWKELMSTAVTIPAIGQQYDFAKIFSYVANLGGIKNLNSFRLQAQVVPDDVLHNQAQAGNVVPMNSNPNEPGQIPGMGATG